MKLDYIMDELKDRPLSDLRDIRYTDYLRSKYDGLVKHQIVLLWFMANNHSGKNLSQTELQTLKEIDNILFIRSSTITDLLNEFLRMIDTKRKNIRDSIKEYDESYKKLSNIGVKQPDKYIDLSSLYKNREGGDVKFVYDNLSFVADMRGDGDRDIDMYDIFERFDASFNIPLVVLIDNENNTRYIKMYDKLRQKSHHDLLKWITIYENPSLPSGVHFKFLIIPKEKYDSKQLLFNNMYSTGYVSPLKKLYFDYTLRYSIDTKTIFDRISSSLKNISIVNLIQQSIKGYIDIDIDRYALSTKTKLTPIDYNVMGFLVMNNDIISKFFQLNEETKTINDKSKFYMYYSPSFDYADNRPLTFSMNIMGVGDNDVLHIRINRAIDYNQILSFIFGFQRLMDLYYKNYDDIISKYEANVPSFKKAKLANKQNKNIKIIKTIKDEPIIIKKSKAQRAEEDYKTGKRSRDLRHRRPDIFLKQGYTSDCQKEKQPYIISEDEYEKRRKKEGDDMFMRFDGDIYACQPREDSDRNKNYIHPGLVKNKRMKNSDTVPNIPCCFVVNQYGKKNSILIQYLKNNEMKKEGGEIEEGKSKEVYDSLAIGHVYAYNKVIKPGRYADMPYMVQKMLGLDPDINVQNIKETHLNLLRVGIINSVDSMIHCLEKVFNPKYVTRGYDARVKYVDMRKQKMFDDIEKYYKGGSAIQEIKDVDIGSILKNNLYVDPKYFHQLLCEVYRCNIFIYYVDKKDKEGNVLIPSSSNVYLRPKTLKKRPNVVIFMIETSDITPYPYQCDLLGELVIENGQIVSLKHIFNTEEDIIKLANDVYNKIDVVYNILPNSTKNSLGYSKYNSV
jgi:hypothetical protein